MSSTEKPAYINLYLQVGLLNDTMQITHSLTHTPLIPLQHSNINSYTPKTQRPLFTHLYAVGTRWLMLKLAGKLIPHIT